MEHDPEAIWNFRTPYLELDSVYGQGPEAQPYLYDGDKLIVFPGDATRPRDLQRNGAGRAIIGDPRNDENVLLAQLQLAFILFHNAVVDELSGKVAVAIYDRLHAAAAGDSVLRPEDLLRLRPTRMRALGLSRQKIAYIRETAYTHMNRLVGLKCLEVRGLIDEVLTPDSSRFWPAEEYRPGSSPPSFDKQFVRDYLETLDWDKWMGQVQPKPYNKNIQISRSNPGWLSIKDFCGGEICGWGSHGLDQIQWALGMDETGPVEIWLEEKDAKGWPRVMMRYASGTLLLQCLASDEVALGRLPGNRPGQTGLERRHGLVHVGAIEMHARLETQGVAGAEADRADVEIEQPPPEPGEPMFVRHRAAGKAS